MKVAIDTGPLRSGHKVRGVGFYTRELLDALQAITKSKKGIQIDGVDFELEEESLHDYDILHYPFWEPFTQTLPDKKQRKTVVTIHDVIPLLYPSQYRPGFRGRVSFAKQKKRLKDVDLIVTDSETSKKDIVRLLPVEPQIVHPVYLAPTQIHPRVPSRDKSAVLKKYKLPKKYVLYVGDVGWNKNVTALVEACIKIETPLVIVGKQAGHLEELIGNIKTIEGPRDALRYVFGKQHPELAHFTSLLSAIQASGDLVHRLGFIPDEDFSALYQEATVYCHPSRYEGFGLGPLEAMAYKVPVVIAKSQTIVEVSGDGAYVADSTSAEDLAKALNKVISSPKLQKELVSKGKSHVKKFSWEKTAKEMLDLYTALI